MSQKSCILFRVRFCFYKRIYFIFLNKCLLRPDEMTSKVTIPLFILCNTVFVKRYWVIIQSSFLCYFLHRYFHFSLFFSHSFLSFFSQYFAQIAAVKILHIRKFRLDQLMNPQQHFMRAWMRIVSIDGMIDIEMKSGTLRLLLLQVVVWVD
jgi:hypothetical protein